MLLRSKNSGTTFLVKRTHWSREKKGAWSSMDEIMKSREAFMVKFWSFSVAGMKGVCYPTLLLLNYTNTPYHPYMECRMADGRL